MKIQQAMFTSREHCLQQFTFYTTSWMWPHDLTIVTLEIRKNGTASFFAHLKFRFISEVMSTLVGLELVSSQNSKLFYCLIKKN
jgi:hypothetical protein